MQIVVGSGGVARAGKGTIESAGVRLVRQTNCGAVGSLTCCRRSPCERPRTYDKFYQKTPGNYQKEQERDSAISLCSSEECEQVNRSSR